MEERRGGGREDFPGDWSGGVYREGGAGAGGGTGGEGLHSPRERKDALGRSGSEASWVVGLQRVEWVRSQAEPGQLVYWA